MKRLLSTFYLLVLAACSAQPTPASPTPQVIRVQASQAAQPWLPEVYACAPAGVVIDSGGASGEVDLRLRIGEPPDLVTPAYQIDSEDILVVTHRQSPAQNMGLDEVRALFAGDSGLDVEIWVFAQGEDIQQVFDQVIMRGSLTTSAARLAATPQEMGDVLNNDLNAAGLLPRHWKMGSSRIIYTIPGIPVLAIVQTAPQGALAELLACLQQ